MHPNGNQPTSSLQLRRARQHDIDAAPAVDAVELPGPASGHDETGLQRRRTPETIGTSTTPPASASQGHRVGHGPDQDERTYLRVSRSIESTERALVRETLHIMDDKQRIALVETRTDMTAYRSDSSATSSAITWALLASSWRTTQRSSRTRSTTHTAARRTKPYAVE